MPTQRSNMAVKLKVGDIVTIKDVNCIDSRKSCVNNRVIFSLGRIEKLVENGFGIKLYFPEDRQKDGINLLRYDCCPKIKVIYRDE